MNAYIQTVAMAWLSLDSDETKNISFLWTTAVDCVSKAARRWSQNFYQESQKAGLRCRAKNICKEVRANIGFAGVAICDECSFFDRRMSSQELQLFNEAVMEAGNYQKLAARFKKTNGLKGHFAEFEADVDIDVEGIFYEQKVVQEKSAKAIGESLFLDKKTEKEGGTAMKKEEGQVGQQEPQKSKGPVGPCEIFLNGRSVWKRICHWSVARKEARYVKTEEAGELDVVELHEGDKKIPPEKWYKQIGSSQQKMRIPSTEEKKSDGGKVILDFVGSGKFYRKFVLEGIVRDDEIPLGEMVSGKLFFQEITDSEVRELLRRGAGLA